MTDSMIFYVLALIGAACFAILFRVPKRFLLPTIFLGFATCVLTAGLPDETGLGIRSAIGAVFVGLCSQAMARVSGKPAQTFIIPSVIFLVPGRHIYHGFRYLLEQQFDQAFAEATVALLISMGVTWGLMLSNWLVPSRKPL